jgi:hypothetical protein
MKSDNDIFRLVLEAMLSPDEKVMRVLNAYYGEENTTRVFSDERFLEVEVKDDRIWSAFVAEQAEKYVKAQEKVIKPKLMDIVPEIKDVTIGPGDNVNKKGEIDDIVFRISYKK